VLQGVISPLRNTSPDDLKIKELVTRLQQGKVKEVILAMNPTREGETTAIYLANIIKPLSLKVTRIAQGIPRGGEIEYLDESTLKSSLEGRREL
jgi:recombination protein RecR